jgi:GNAT superfamily N-acetyltransferase
MHIRPVTSADLPAIARVGLANDEHSATDPNYVAHLRSVGRFLVAEIDGTVAAYGAARRAGGVTMLCDLFVDPARHSAGVGRSLLDAVLQGSGERFTFASRDPRAMSLYVRQRMIPRWPLLFLSGPPLRPGVLRCRQTPMAEAGEAERELIGGDQASSYAYWATRPRATGLIVEEDGEILAAGAAEPGELLHLATAPGHDPAATLTAALATFTAERVRLTLPGPHPALAPLLDAGWRIEDSDQFLSTSDGLLSPTHVPSNSLG